MESRRLVVWISAGILGFQGATLAFDLLNCTVLSWLFVRQHGLGLVRPDARGEEARPGAQQSAGLKGAAGQQEPSIASPPQGPQGPGQSVPPASPSPAGPPPVLGAFDPTGVFCAQPRSRIDDAVSQGLTILAGLALGSSVGGGGRPGSAGNGEL
jgi:hypothetical protein